MDKPKQVVVPAHMIPGFRVFEAFENGTEKNILITTWGGIGDQVCAEPTVRWVVENYGDKNDVSLATHIPQAFRHLTLGDIKLKRVFDLNEEIPVYDKYLVLKTLPQQEDLAWQFYNHNLMHCVDYCSIAALRLMLPNKDKEVRLFSTGFPGAQDSYNIVVHPGKHWPSKTFPKEWWDELLAYLVGLGFTPVIIGKNVDKNVGTVDVSTEGCVDLRNQLDINGFINVLQNSKVVITNDSAPLHIAATGKAHIGYVATCKHPDYLTHWRQGEFGWRMKNFGTGGIWEHFYVLPNSKTSMSADTVDPELLASWLPQPLEIAEWAKEKVEDWDETIN